MTVRPAQKSGFRAFCKWGVKLSFLFDERGSDSEGSTDSAWGRGRQRQGCTCEFTPDPRALRSQRLALLQSWMTFRVGKKAINFFFFLRMKETRMQILPGWEACPFTCLPGPCFPLALERNGTLYTHTCDLCSSSRLVKQIYIDE